MKSSSYFLIHRLKVKAKELYANYQIPLCVCKRIQDLDYKACDENYLKFLMAFTERVIRVRGYYKKYKSENALIEKTLIDSEKQFYERGK